MCRGVVRTQMLGGSARSGWARRRSVRSFTSFRFLRSEFYSRSLPTSTSSWKLLQRFQESSSTSRQTNGRYTPHRRSTLRHRLAQSHQQAICLRASFSTLSEFLRSWLQFWTSSEAHAHWRKSSEWIRVWQERNQELGAPRRGVSSSLLWSSPKLASGHRDGHRRPRRRAESADSNASTRNSVRDARVCSKGQLLGLSDSNARPDVHRLLPKASAVVAWHTEAAALETARKQHRELALARTVPARRSTRHPRTGEQRRKGQRRRGKLRPGRDLHDPAPARPPDRARQFPRHQSGWPMFFLH